MRRLIADKEPSLDGPLDELDRQIIAHLRTDARRSNTDLAKQLGVSEGTIRNRIRRLIGQGYMIVVAMTCLNKLGYDVDVLIEVTTEAGKQLEVARRLSRLPATRYVALTTGGYDIIVGATFKTNRDLFHFLTAELAAIPGIARTQTSHVLRTLKRVQEWVTFEDEQDESPTPGHDVQAAGAPRGAAQPVP